MITIQSQRDMFDIPENIAYFNCAYYSPILNESRARLINGVNSKSHPWERKASDFFEDAEKIRILSSDLFGGDPDAYAIVPAVSYGISTAARAIEPQLKEGNQILLVEEEFPSNVLPWRRVCQETGATILTVRTPADGNWTQAIINSLDCRIKVCALSSCHWTNGARIDLKAISIACKKLDCILVVDATQTLGAIPLTIDEIEPDFLVAAGYKWLLCPYGFSLLYVSEKWRNSRPLEETWLARDNAEDFTGLVNYSDKYMPGSRKFDVGEKCMPTILPGTIAALEQIKAWNISLISDTLSIINNEIALHLESMGFRIVHESYRSPHMFGAILPEDFKGDLVNELNSKRIYVSQRGNSVRFAPHLHVSDYDVARLLDAITRLGK